MATFLHVFIAGTPPALSNMEENNLKSFSITALFLVTGFSCLLFYAFLRILDGTNAFFFIWAGCAALVAGFISFVWQLLQEKENTKRKKRKHSRMHSQY
ncbi:MAG: hypothetical protein IPP93_12770 [Chitinophagaceae bacterium]|nr:hypothetical protein [Chitinophagaceae bacterium]MBL0336751.1 hypothetical protein [Chitinophagaceae bacterium]